MGLNVEAADRRENNIESEPIGGCIYYKNPRTISYQISSVMHLTWVPDSSASLHSQTPSAVLQSPRTRFKKLCIVSYDGYGFQGGQPASTVKVYKNFLSSNRRFYCKIP